MKGSATVQIQKRPEKFGGDKYFIYLPKNLVQVEKLEAKTIVDFEINNTGSKYERKAIPFKKKIVPEGVEGFPPIR